MVMKECPKCGSIGIDKGIIRSDQYIIYTTGTQKGFLPKQEMTESYVCLRCGYIETYITDTEKLKQHIQE